MEKKDFYKLTIGQVIWYKGEECVILVLDGVVRDSIKTTYAKNYLYYWDDICQDCSFEPPKKKKKIKVYVGISYEHEEGKYPTTHAYTNKEDVCNCKHGIHEIEIEVGE